MDDLIYRQLAIDAVQGIGRLATLPDNDAVVRMSAVEYVLFNLPSAQPKTGKWTWSKEDSSWCCGACRCVFEEIEWKPEYNFCPNCGARMEGEQNET